TGSSRANRSTRRASGSGGSTTQATTAITPSSTSSEPVMNQSMASSPGANGVEMVRVPYVDLALQHRAIKAELLEAAAGVIDTGMFVLGPQVEAFERQLAALIGVKHAIGVNSGTDALVLSLRALGVGPGDEVITAPNSFIASASAIALTGATPVFVDVDEHG